MWRERVELRATLGYYLKDYAKACQSKDFSEIRIEMARIHGFLRAIMEFSMNLHSELNSIWTRWHKRCEKLKVEYVN